MGADCAKCENGMKLDADTNHEKMESFEEILRFAVMLIPARVISSMQRSPVLALLDE